MTRYSYGTTLIDSDIATSTLKRAEAYPDSVDDDDRILFAYNRQSETSSVTDQNGTVHSYDYDLLGRQTQDRVSALGAGVDGAVRRIATTYEVRGMRKALTSYDNASVGQGNVVNQVQFAYNDFEQITHDYQAHDGAVNISTTPNVQYGYDDASDNTVRQTTLTYPNGRVLTYDYGTSGGIDDSASRIAAIVDDDASSTHLCEYSYLGQSTFVEQDDTEPDIKWTLVDLAGANNPDTGDIYSGFDRFGRVVDNRWYDYGSSADVDRIQYGYDRAGNRIWRHNTVAAALGKEFDELYSYDGIQRLKDMARGRLNAQRTALTSETFAQCWTLDATGNWSKFLEDDDGDGTWELDQARAANKVNEITDISETAGPSWVTPAYDANGNMTTIPQPADPTASFTATYDAWNRLVKVAAGASTVVESAYDPLRREAIHKTYSGGTLDETRHQYFSRMWQVLEQRLGSSSHPDEQFVWGTRYIDGLVQRDRDTTSNGTPDERLYAIQDANWNVTSVTNNAGSIQERYSNHPYGTPSILDADFAGQTHSLYDWHDLFSGYSLVLRLGTYYVRNRQFNPTTATWLQRDPAAYADGHSLYMYSQSRPLSSTDPFGLDTVYQWIPTGAWVQFDNCPCRKKTHPKDMDRPTAKLRNAVWDACKCVMGASILLNKYIPQVLTYYSTYKSLDDPKHLLNDYLKVKLEIRPIIDKMASACKGDKDPPHFACVYCFESGTDAYVPYTLGVLSPAKPKGKTIYFCNDFKNNPDMATIIHEFARLYGYARLTDATYNTVSIENVYVQKAIVLSLCRSYDAILGR